MNLVAFYLTSNFFGCVMKSLKNLDLPSVMLNEMLFAMSSRLPQ